MNESTDSEENTGSQEPHASTTSSGAFDSQAEPQIAHPYVLDDCYRRFTDELDWGII
ncbi:MAG: hypothetical protein JWQ64_1897 [Subtercola sp.]|jgi:hypothetical protein|nr:hypothetical protein [Subtercola sp.]